MGITLRGIRAISARFQSSQASSSVFEFLTPAGSVGTMFDGVNADIQLITNAPQNAPVSYMLSAGTLPSGFNLDILTGKITGSAAFVNDLTTYFFAVAATYAGKTVTRAFNVTIKPNLAPVWKTNALPRVLDRVPYEFQLEATDQTPGQTLTYSLSSGTMFDGLTLSENGVISGVAAPFASPSGVRSVTFSVSDGIKSVTKQFDFSFARNVAPVWNTPENVGEGLGSAYFAATLQATDANGEALTYRLDPTTPLIEGLTLTASGAIYGVLPPALTENQTIPFTVIVSDGYFEVSKSFTITALVNVNPVFTVGGSVEAIELHPTDIALTAVDPLGQSEITYSVIGSLPPGMSFFNGVLSGTPTAVVDVTDYTFSVEASNGPLSTTQEFTFRVSPDMAPVWSTEQGEILRALSGLTVSTRVVAADPNGMPVSYTLQTGTLPTGLNLNGETGVISGKLSMVAQDTTKVFVVRASDGTKFTDREFSIFHGRNTAPVWSTPSMLGSAPGGTVNQFVISATDAETTNLAYNLQSGSQDVSFDPATRTLTFSLPQNAVDGFLSRTVRVSDGVNEVNRSFTMLNKFSRDPVITTTVISKAVEQTPYTFQVQALHPGNLGFTFEVVDGALPTGLALNATTGVISGTPAPESVDTNYTFTIRVTNEISSVEREFILTVETNVAPVWVTSAGSLGETLANNDVEYNLAVTDANGTTPVVSALTPLPAGLSLSGMTIAGKLAVVEEDTVHEFTLRASDGVANADRDFSILVYANSDPVWTTAANLGKRTEDSNISIPLVATDPERQPVSMTLVAGELPDGIALSDNRLIGRTPVLEDTTVYTFTIAASDGVKTVEREFTLEIENNYEPVWETEAGSLGDVLSGYGGYSFQLVATDANDTPVSYSIMSGSIPTGMSFQNGRVYNVGQSKVAVAAQDTVYTFVVRASDGVFSVDREFSINVLKNEAPVFVTPSGLIVTQESGTEVSFQFEATDTEGRPLAFAFSGSGYPSGFQISETGLLTGTLPVVTQDTSYTFSVKVSDGARETTSEFSIYSQFSSAPIWQTNSVLQSGREGSAVSIQLSALAGSNTVTYSAIDTLPSGLTLSSSGLLGGTRPLVDGNTVINIPVRATASTGYADRTFTMNVLDNLVPVWTTPEGEIAAGMEGDPISATVAATDADDTVTYDLVSGDLEGLSLNSTTGAITGTLPEVSATRPIVFVIGAFDGSIRVDREFFITVRNGLTFSSATITSPDAPTTAAYDVGEEEAGDWSQYNGSKDRNVSSGAPTSSATMNYTRDFEQSGLFTNPSSVLVTTAQPAASATQNT